MQRPILCAVLLGITTGAFAQETYWVASRNSNDLMQVSAWGAVLQRIPMSTGLRSAHLAPDGMIWVVEFSGANVDIVNPDTGVITAIPVGAAYDLAFDAAGHAWVVASPTDVVELDASGAVVQTLTFVAAAMRNMTIDALGNKWIADYVAPPTMPSLARIDGTTGVVTTVPLPGATIRPVRPVADYRGPMQPSHIWVTGDATAGVGQLIELDNAGTVLNIYPLPSAQVGGTGPVFDNSGAIWTGDFLTGDVYRVDASNGAITTYNTVTRASALAVDSFGRIWKTSRISLFNGVGPPCEVSRFDTATGTLEIPSVLEIGGNGAYGSQSALATPHHYSLVVDPFGDMDGDSQANITEILQGSSPIDADSDGTFSVNTTGVTQIGSTATIRVQSTTIWVLGFSEGLIPATPVPGFVGELLIDVGTLAGTLSGFGPTNIPLPIPGNPGLQGYDLFLQGVILSGGQFEFRNASGIRVW